MQVAELYRRQAALQVRKGTWSMRVQFEPRPARECHNVIRIAMPSWDRYLKHAKRVERRRCQRPRQG